jgi:hypothetical protein
MSILREIASHTVSEMKGIAITSFEKPHRVLFRVFTLFCREIYQFSLITLALYSEALRCEERLRQRCDDSKLLAGCIYIAEAVACEDHQVNCLQWQISE